MTRRRATEDTPRRAAWPHLTLWLALLAACAVSYSPAMFGALVWDDNAHLTSPELRSLTGLARIWFDPGATQQWYPVVHSAFWLLGKMDGGHPVLYHVVNVALHATVAFLIYLVTRDLKIPGGRLAAFIFALHPVHVESVAWISELKNVLSAVFYLVAFRAYLRFHDSRTRSAYALALGAFVLALLSKSVTAMLPFGIAIALWWRAGRLDPRRDGVPLMPFVLLGGLAGLFTAWIERTYVGAIGADYALSGLDRIAVAARAVCFYVWKLIVPVGLAFNYPRWNLQDSGAISLLCALLVIATFAVCWRVRAVTRAPLAALLFFCATLFPSLGFIDVYPFRYSYVADHFQYLASLGIIVPVAAALATLALRTVRGSVMRAAGVALCVVLAAATWRQSRHYADAETLYAATIEVNPGSWLAQSNLGATMLRSNPSAAAQHLRAAIQLKPDLPEAVFNLGLALEQTGDASGAATQFREALRLNPSHPTARKNLGVALARAGRLPEAIVEFQEVLRRNPEPPAYLNLVRALADNGAMAQAVTVADDALKRFGDNVDVVSVRGELCLRQGDPAGAIQFYQRALALSPNSAVVHNSLGVAFARSGNDGEAIAHYDWAIALDSGFQDPIVNSALSLMALGLDDNAITAFDIAIQLAPTDIASRLTVAGLLVKHRRYDEARQHIAAVLQLEPNNPQALSLAKRLDAIIK